MDKQTKDEIKGWLMEGLIIVLAAIAVGLLVAIAFIHPAKSHSFYDPECCSGKDCAPVTLMQKHPEGDIMTSEHGTVLVRPNSEFKRKVSPDGGFHVCMRRSYPFKMKNDGSYEMEVICVYYPQLY